MEPFLGEIKLIAFNYAPRGWAFCNGQQMNIAQNQALYALLGTQFGGDGKTYFNLPDLRGRTPRFPSTLDEKFGVMKGAEGVTLQTNNLPAHNHTIAVNKGNGTIVPPTGAFLSATKLDTQFSGGFNAFKTTPDTTAKYMASDAIAIAGSSQQHNNMQPFLVLNYCIALSGVYPSRG